MRKFILILAAACVAATARPSSAADSAALPESVAEFVNGQTVLVARFDFAEFDISATVQQWLKPIATTTEEQNILSAVVEQFDGWCRQLKAEGISEIYVISSIGDLPDVEQRDWKFDIFSHFLVNTTIAVIPGASGKAIESMHATLQDKAKHTWPDNHREQWPDCREIRGAAVVGMGTLLDHLKDLKPSPRPEFQTALAAVETRPIRAAVVPPPLFAGCQRNSTATAARLLGPAGTDSRKWFSLAGSQ